MEQIGFYEDVQIMPVAEPAEPSQPHTVVCYLYHAPKNKVRVAARSREEGWRIAHSFRAKGYEVQGVYPETKTGGRHG